MDAAEPPIAWVLTAVDPRAIRRAERLLARDAEVLRTVGFGSSRCVELGPGPSARLRERVERRIGEPVEARLDCDVARFPIGRGWIVVLIEAPAAELDDALDALGLSYREVARPSGPGELIRVCTPTAGVVDPAALDESLVAEGLVVHAVYEVGGCSRG